MPTPLGLALLFAESFVVYSLLRYPDEKSTKKLAQRVDLQKHEVNPLLTLLARKWSLNAAFRVTWVLTASIIAAADTFLGITISPGIPAVAFFFGTVHVLAAASNIQLDYRTKNTSREEIDAETYKFARSLSSLDWKGRWTLLIERYAFTFVVTIVSLAAIFLYLLSSAIDPTSEFSNVGAVISNLSSVEIGAILLFFPSIFFGSIAWSRRLTKFYRSGKLVGPAGPGGQYIEIPVSIAEEALNIAKSKQASTIRLQLNAIPSTP
ncbi:hypothetical protein E6H32_10340 [Candidatus Bathyarchaeota archaeon]|nr:MAG: hypothetical protein E6H32_10340 [Candidatus Bathyarchaeota archaeon]